MTRQEIKELLPPGFAKVIAERSGFSKTYIYQWVQGKKESVKIEMEVMKYLADILEQKKQLLDRIKAAL